MIIAARVGMLVEDMLERITMHELRDWYAELALEGEEAADRAKAAGI